ncbi:hypothetical protein BESB_022760 [Besnoitia besnoiti]|uniref:CHCH domain-containing protein n=1 Tax=Besnoitia besnoiti TaxID=94643 RepID=A0A2A9M3I8_BESBE|nr:hypothetical protein BESB_022760 [Besnoitia besnoiti]PFH31784.1 hypothetical protein BESB_022760 [Besnoitia besnoiti]
MAGEKNETELKTTSRYPEKGESSTATGTAPKNRAQMSKYWGDDVDDKVERTGCSEPYSRLVDCLDVYDKDWRKCREELQEFRRCCHEKKVPGA